MVGSQLCAFLLVKVWGVFGGCVWLHLVVMWLSDNCDLIASESSEVKKAFSKQKCKVKA